MQFTKHGSIFVCVRIYNPQEDTFSSMLTSSLSSSPASEGSHRGKRQYDVSKLVKIVESREWSASDIRLEGVGVVEAMAPRLSMQEGPLNTEEAVKKWRNWVPKAGVEGEDSVEGSKTLSLVISVEDTGKCLEMPILGF